MTCSLLRAENDSIVASFVDAHADAAVRPLAPPPAAAAHATATGVTFFPSHAHAGGYVALLRKAESAVESTSSWFGPSPPIKIDSGTKLSLSRIYHKAPGFVAGAAAGVALGYKLG